MFAATKPVKVVAYTGAVVAVPLAVISGVALTNSAAIYAAYIACSILMVGALAGAWFGFISKRLGGTRVRMCCAGALSAVATALSFELVFSVPASIVSNSGWFGTFLLYVIFCLTTLLPFLLLTGALAGLIASLKWFSV
jgi:hypothetical protein